MFSRRRLNFAVLSGRLTCSSRAGCKFSDVLLNAGNVENRYSAVAVDVRDVRNEAGCTCGHID